MTSLELITYWLSRQSADFQSFDSIYPAVAWKEPTAYGFSYEFGSEWIFSIMVLDWFDRTIMISLN